MTLAPGIHTIPSEQYHSDEIADRPSLSASIASILCQRSPRHAWAAHPKLNPLFTREAESKFDVGNTAHSILLEGKPFEEVAVIIAADSWRTNLAKEARDHARAVGMVPLLEKDAAAVRAMLDAVAAQLEAIGADPPLFTDGEPERTLAWEEDGVLCRARLDWLRDDHTAIDDLKTTGRSAEPAAYSKNLFGVGGDLQAAFYRRGVRALTGVEPEFRWCVVECEPPYALAVISPGPDVLALGDDKVRYALETWKRCLDTGTWPGYPERVCYAEMPAYEETRWMAREAREEMAA